MRSDDLKEEVHVNEMSRGKRLALIAVAVFCLLIFTVTGPMADVLTRAFAGKPPVYGTLELPSGPAEITAEEYQRAARQKERGERMMQQVFYTDNSRESILAYATLMKLADELKIEVGPEQLRSLLGAFAAQGEQAYMNFYKSFGLRTAQQFESEVKNFLRISAVVDLLSVSAAPREQDIMDEWASMFEEMNVEYVVFHPNQFIEEAANIAYEEQEINDFYDEGLTPIQRSELEVEQAVSFDVISVDSESMNSELLQSWFTAEEPSEEALDGFYASNKYLLYMREDLGKDDNDGLEPILTREELGGRVRNDYHMHQAVTQLAFDLASSEDPEAYALEKGAKYSKYEDMITLSELNDLPEIGGVQLRRLFQGDEGSWMQTPIQMTDRVLLMRPLEKRDRVLPALEEIRDDVVDFWRESQQATLAMEAAESFIANLPKSSDYVEGDPVSVASEAFQTAASSANLAVEQMGWVARTVRIAVDPFWPSEADVLRGLRSQIGVQLDDLVDGQVIGPNDFADNGIAVAHLISRRDANRDSVYPAEYNRAKLIATQKAYSAFQTDGISYEGLANLYQLRKTEAE
jgi:hypothetical protein